MASDIMTVHEAAEYLRMSGETVKRHAREGLIPCAKVGRQWRFRKGELDRWLDAGGSRYEDLVDQGLAQVTLERMAKPEGFVSLEEVKAKYGS